MGWEWPVSGVSRETFPGVASSSLFTAGLFHVEQPAPPPSRPSPLTPTVPRETIAHLGRAYAPTHAAKMERGGIRASFPAGVPPSKSLPHALSPLPLPARRRNDAADLLPALHDRRRQTAAWFHVKRLRLFAIVTCSKSLWRILRLWADVEAHAEYAIPAGSTDRTPPLLTHRGGGLPVFERDERGGTRARESKREC